MRSIPRALSALLVVALVLGGLAALWQSWRSTPTSAAPGQDGWVSTSAGPLGPADRDLVIRVRQAGLWEHPTGQEMADRGVQPRVREIGQKISAEHLDLDAKTITIARDLGIVLPNQPSDQQRAWMSEISSQAGAAYDTVAVNRLRQAHGIVLPLLTTIRVSTRNAAVRAFAEDASTYVIRHIGYLESTGLVDFDALPEAPAPNRAVVTTTGTYQNVPVALTALGVVLFAAVLIGLAVRMLPQRRPKTRRGSRPQHAGTPRRRHQAPRTAAPRPPPTIHAMPDPDEETAMITRNVR